MIVINKNAIKITEKAVKIQDCINNNPNITVSQISSITGIPIATISRICKQMGINKKDMRCKINEISDSSKTCKTKD